MYSRSLKGKGIAQLRNGQLQALIASVPFSNSVRGSLTLCCCVIMSSPCAFRNRNGGCCFSAFFFSLGMSAAGSSPGAGSAVVSRPCVWSRRASDASSLFVER